MIKRYRYNGKERDEESGLYYYGARYYAPWTSRFVSIDPLAGKYPFYTSYQYAGNKPINFIDLDGLEEADTSKRENFSDSKFSIDENGEIQLNKPLATVYITDHVETPCETSNSDTRATSGFAASTNKGFWAEVGDFVSKAGTVFGAAVSTIASNQILGAGRMDPTANPGIEKQIRIGQTIGDGVSIVLGFLEMGGGLKDIGNAPKAATIATPGGTVAMIGVGGAVAAKGVVKVFHGGGVVHVSFGNFMGDLEYWFASDGTGGGGGGEMNPMRVGMGAETDPRSSI